MITVRHAGDLGDILYSLPVARTLATGRPIAFLIEAASYTRQQLIPPNWCGIDELLMRQPYICAVRPWHQGESVNYNLNDFRARLFQSLKHGIGKDKHLIHWMCEAHGVPHSCADAPWLEAEPDPVARVVFSRAGAGRPAHQVYQNPAFPWHFVWEKYHKDAIFIGTEHEHELFSCTCGRVAHYKTKGLYEAARVIAGCDLFVGNQTATHAIAEGMKKRILLEVWPEGANCLVHRPGVTHGWDQYVKLPDL